MITAIGQLFIAGNNPCMAHRTRLSGAMDPDVSPQALADLLDELADADRVHPDVSVTGVRCAA